MTENYTKRQKFTDACCLLIATFVFACIFHDGTKAIIDPQKIPVSHSVKKFNYSIPSSLKD